MRTNDHPCGFWRHAVLFGYAFFLAFIGQILSGASLWAAGIVLVPLYETGDVICINGWQYVEVAPGSYALTGVGCDIVGTDIRGRERQNEDFPLRPVVFSPHNTGVLGPKPTLQWVEMDDDPTDASDNVAEYQLRLTGGTEPFAPVELSLETVTCRNDTLLSSNRICSTPWPAAWFLQPDEEYFLTISAFRELATAPDNSEVSPFHTLNVTTTAQIEQALATIQQLPVELSTSERLQGDLFMQYGLYAEAIPRYKQLIAEQPSPESHQKLGNAYSAIEFYRFASLTYSQTIELLDQGANQIQLRADVEFGWGQAEYNRLRHVSAEPHFVEAGRLYSQLGLRKGEAATELLLGNIAKRAKRYSAAEEHYDRAHELYIALGFTEAVKQVEDALGDLK